MNKSQTIKIIIPAYNEEASIARVIKDIPPEVDEIIVVNNKSTDRTKEVALLAGAKVLDEVRLGYGYACLKGLDYLKENPCDIVVFLDGDYSDYPEQLTKLVEAIINDEVDFVIGSRVKHLREQGSMTPQQIFGNWLAIFLMRILFKSKFTDLGPFRAIRHTTLQSINMQDKTYGWTVEMQLKVLKYKIKYKEVPVMYRNRIGKSKVSGTIKGTIMAGVKILGWIFKYSFK
ncbi:MAG: glycosyltransferase family 2 protein [Flavobacteriales bacterium]|jgi:glycosyltransferase involved in cell wall biosynthesis|nr:glycosyltransferase family 2 protein [Flavobacteriales bacterium]